MGWRQGQAYSQDLRDRVLAAVDRGMPVYQAAPAFDVSVSYIYKALARRRETGEISARPQCSHTPAKLTEHYGAITAFVTRTPDATLVELRDWLLQEYGAVVSQGAMWNTLHRLGLTLKKSRSTRASRNVPMSRKPDAPGANGSRS